MSIIMKYDDGYTVEFDREDLEYLIKKHVISVLSLEEGTDLEKITVSWPRFADVRAAAAYDE